MRIAFLSVFHPYRGGISQFSTSLFQALGEKSSIKAYNFKRQYPTLFFPGKSQFVSPEKENPFPNLKLLDSINPATYRKTAQEINVFSPDLLLTSYWLPFFGPALGGVAKRMHFNCKKVSILHNVVPHESRIFDKQLTRRFLDKNDGFIVMSTKVKDDLLNIKPDAKYHFQPHPLYQQFGAIIDQKLARESLNIPSNKKILLFFGFIRKYKGLDFLLNALAELPDDYHLIVAGECYEKFDPYQQIIDQKNLHSKITLRLEYIPHKEVSTIFSASDLVVLPYRSATQSGILAIAYHFNKAVMATPVGGLSESIVEGKTGFLVNDTSPIALASSIESAFPLPENLKNEIELLKSELSWEKFADHLLEFSSRL